VMQVNTEVSTFTQSLQRLKDTLALSKAVINEQQA
jgi:hypothetical protein